MSTAFSVFRDGAIEDLAPLLDLGASGNLNSALYLSVGIDFLLDLLMVASNGLASSTLSTGPVAWVFWGGGVFISIVSTPPLLGSSWFSPSSSAGSGVFSGSGSGIRLAADPVTSSSSAGESRSISSSSSSSALST